MQVWCSQPCIRCLMCRIVQRFSSVPANTMVCSLAVTFITIKSPKNTEPRARNKGDPTMMYVKNLVMVSQQKARPHRSAGDFHHVVVKHLVPPFGSQNCELRVYVLLSLHSSQAVQLMDRGKSPALAMLVRTGVRPWLACQWLSHLRRTRLYVKPEQIRRKSNPASRAKVPRPVSEMNE